MKNIDLNIKEILKRKEISIKDFCSRIGMTEQGYSYMIKNESIKVSTLKTISEVLEVSVFNLLENTSEIVSEPIVEYKKTCSQCSKYERLLDQKDNLIDQMNRHIDNLTKEVDFLKSKKAC